MAEALEVGTLALVGGDPWQIGCTFDRDLLDASGGDSVTLLPTAAAYEKPEKQVRLAEQWFASLGASVEVVHAYGRRDAMDESLARVVERSRFIYLAGGSPMHLVSVLKRSRLLDAIRIAWRSGAVLAGAGSGGDVLCDPMIDTRGGAFTVGLGLVRDMSMVPRANALAEETIERTVRLAKPDHVIAAVPEQTALLRDPHGTWTVAGVGEVTFYCDGAAAGIEVMNGVEINPQINQR